METAFQECLHYIENIKIIKPRFRDNGSWYELDKGTHRGFDLALLILGQFKSRIEEFLGEPGSFSPGVPFSILPSRIVDMTLLRTPNPQELMRAFWKHPMLGRQVHRMYRVDFKAKQISGVVRFLLERQKSCPEIILRIQAKRDFADKLIAELPEEFPLHPTEYTHVLFLFRSFRKYHFGLYEKGTCEFGAMQSQRTRTTEHEVSRAYWKLAECFERLPMMKLPKDAVCLDIGSSPGGWSQVLCEKGALKVIAVDPGHMAFKAPNLIHERKKIQDLKFEPETFDMIVSDMNRQFEELDEEVSNIMRWLKPGGRLVLTLKLLDRMRVSKNEKLLSHIRERHPQIGNTKLIWLLANTSKERTLFGTKTRATITKA